MRRYIAKISPNSLRRFQYILLYGMPLPDYVVDIIDTYGVQGRQSEVQVQVNSFSSTEIANPQPYIVYNDECLEFSELSSDYLGQNFPNPFNAITSIEFQLPESSPVKLTIYDIQGREVVTLIITKMSAGFHSVKWDADSYPSGVYLYRLSASGFDQTKKMLLLK